jgi:hypothetical protein
MKIKRGVLAACLVLGSAAIVFAAFFQSFELNTAGWFGANRVPTLTNGVPSKTGAFHAEDGGGAFTRWGGYSQSFPPGGYVTTVDIYLDISPPYMTGSLTPYPNDTRFDWTSAISTPECVHRRDFVFNAGFYTDTDITGTGPRFVISASNNAGRGGAFPKNPGRSPYTVTLEGWYTFEHEFSGVPGGPLTVYLRLKNAAGVTLMTWTLSDPTDIIGSTVGGNRYGWFPLDEFPSLAFDTSALLGFQDFCVIPQSTPGAKVTGGGWIPWGSSKATFGLTAQAKTATTASGNLTYQDHSSLTGRSVKSTAISSVMVNGPCADINGAAKVNGADPPVGFQLHVCDNGEPGKDSDTFSIFMGDGYTASGTLGGGNIQIH